MHDDFSVARGRTELHEVSGPIALIAIHFGDPAADGLDQILSMRWQDTESGKEGQSSHVRLALYVERDGVVVVEDSGHPSPVEVADDARSLRTEGYPEDGDDPILRLPRY